MKRILFFISSIGITLSLCSWGFYAHRLIHKNAIYTLPTDLAVFYKYHSLEIIEKSVAADRRVYAVTEEGPRHYIDIEDFHENSIADIPLQWQDAKEKYGEEKLSQTGIVPWQIYHSYRQLVEAFKNKDKGRIIRISADIGHYISDAHVPLHTTRNHNGQFSNQLGIHAFWESRLPEKYAEGYILAAAKAEWIENPLKNAWKIVESSHVLVDSVLGMEKALSERYPKSLQKAYVKRNNALIHNYSDEYAEAYHQSLNGMVEKRMRESVHQVASYWYSAWVEAGQPNLGSLLKGKRKYKKKSSPITESPSSSHHEDRT